MGKNILLGVTGSIAGYKACELTRLFRKKGHSVRCVMSRDAGWFVTPLSLETLSGQKVVSEMFESPEQRDPAHISLADGADVILIAPATADVIGRIAAGLCDDILTCTVCASSAPVILAPAMNDKMYANPIVQDKMNYLKDKGYIFIEPVEGALACNREGMGHLAPLDVIVEGTEKLLSK